MCTLCQTLNPSVETYDFHGLESLGDVTESYSGTAEFGNSADLPTFSYDQIAAYLTDGYWNDTGRSGRSFDVQTGDTLTVDLSGLGSKGAATALKALDAWSAVSGLRFVELSSIRAPSTGPTDTIFEGADAAANSNTTARIEVGERFKGTISSAFEKDWIAVDLVKGQTYTINLSGDGSKNAISDTYLKLIGPNGYSVATNDDRAAGDRSSEIEFTAGKTGTFYIQAGGYGNYTGNYKVDIAAGKSTSFADITFSESSSGAYASSTVIGGKIQSSSINIDDSWTKYGTYYLQTYIHEIGHALGLGHSGNYNGSASFGSNAHFANDSWQTTVMSYFDQTDNPNTNASKLRLATPQLGDIAAIQSLYGTPTTTNTGNTVYGDGQNTGQHGMNLSSSLSVAIYDNGGIDTINLASRSHNQRLDLREETYSDLDGKKGNVSIARDTVIENAVTGSGNDHITGNSADNLLVGGHGNDTILGSSGNDTLNGEGGHDLLDGGAGVDTVAYNTSIDNHRIVYNASAANGGKIWALNLNNAQDTLINIEKLQFSDASLDVANILTKLKAIYGNIALDSSASYTVNLSELDQPPIIEKPQPKPETEPKPEPVDPEPVESDATMQIGSTRVEQLNSSQWHSVSFDEAIKDAAVVMGPASSEGDQPLTLRVRNVTDTGFEFQIDEWDYLDGVHLAVDISWMAGSVGDHVMADGTRITFGQTDAKTPSGGTVSLKGFNDTPIVFAQLTGDAESRALRHRLDDISADSFDFVVQAQEKDNTALRDIADEDLYWVALDVADGSSIFESGTLSTDHDYTGTGTVLDRNEAFFADMQTLYGTNPAGLRYAISNSGHISLRVEEEQSRNTETEHTFEDMAWLTLSEGVFDLA